MQQGDHGASSPRGAVPSVCVPEERTESGAVLVVEDEAPSARGDRVRSVHEALTREGVEERGPRTLQATCRGDTEPNGGEYR